jgi:alpha-tubulin suppressor-like RCC1 family protein
LPTRWLPWLAAGTLLGGCDGSEIVYGQAEPVLVAGVSSAKSVAGAADEACALTVDGRVSCWKWFDMVAEPLEIEGVATMALGPGYRCVARVDGGVWCWGANESGQLGDGTRHDRGHPTAVIDVVDAVAVTAGPRHACALDAMQRAWCWGDNDEGQLGVGEASGPRDPTVVLDDAVAIAAGGTDWGSYTCAVRTDGSTWCWGATRFGLLGTGQAAAPDAIEPAPVRVALDEPARTIAAGEWNACLTLDDGGIGGWGQCAWSSCAVETDAPLLAPRRIAGMTRAVEIVIGDGHACTRRDDGRVWCWGGGEGGELGDGTRRLSAWPTPAHIGGAVSIAAGDAATCAALDDGTVWCWGMVRVE